MTINMRLAKYERIAIAEALLPLLLYADGQGIYFAALLIPLATGATLLLFEALRRVLPPGTAAAVYLFWLALCGASAWGAIELPPYWLWSMHLLIPPAVWAPAEAERARPALFGLKKYAVKRIPELIAALVALFLVAALLGELQSHFKGIQIWIIAGAALLGGEIILSRWMKRP